MNKAVASLEAQARALLASDLVTAPTRAALTARLEPCAEAPMALSLAQVETLATVAGDLLPLGALGERVQLARRLDAQLHAGPGDGWRYADMAPDTTACAAGLDALASAAAPLAFADLPAERRRTLLAQAQAGDLPGEPPRWFEETLAALTRLAYAHPLVQLEIGYDGMADAHGFQDLHAAPR